ncbi:hypothetical protein [Nocardioides sp. WS12]|uniref:hypothetical protein n=1 Tax=Nocardioides sp. WS12 TaxID=2486272 RepID=UPI00191EA490|nr:hypothetical protein [Nocardioides sp. WS12]
MTEDDESICMDCGVNTAPLDGDNWEYYMVHDDLWLSAVPGDEGQLCIGCIERRIGRRLVPADFTDAPVNDPHDPWDSERMRSRKCDHCPDPNGEG